MQLQKLEPKRNMQRYYELFIVPTLFGDFALVRHWGRFGTRGQSRSQFFASQEDAAKSMRAWALRKKRRGYQLRT